MLALVYNNYTCSLSLTLALPNNAQGPIALATPAHLFGYNMYMLMLAKDSRSGRCDFGIVLLLLLWDSIVIYI